MDLIFGLAVASRARIFGIMRDEQIHELMLRICVPFGTPNWCTHGPFFGSDFGAKLKAPKHMPQLLRHAFSAPYFVSNSGPKSWPRNHAHGLNPA